MLRRITLGGVSITTAATNVCVLRIRVRITYAFLQLNNCIYIAALVDEISSRNNKKAKEMTTFLYVLSDHPMYSMPSEQLFHNRRPLS